MVIKWDRMVRLKAQVVKKHNIDGIGTESDGRSEMKAGMIVGSLENISLIFFNLRISIQ